LQDNQFALNCTMSEPKVVLPLDSVEVQESSITADTPIRYFKYEVSQTKEDSRCVARVHCTPVEARLELRAALGVLPKHTRDDFIGQRTEGGQLSLEIGSYRWKHSFTHVFFSVSGGQEEKPVQFEIRAGVYNECEFYPPETQAAFFRFKEIFAGIDSNAVSHSDRHRLQKQSTGLDGKSLTYGEISFFSFSRILEMVEIQPGDTFFDLGSGAGKACIAAHLLVPQFSKCVGLELLQGLYDTSLAAAEQMGSPVVQFVQGDILEYDWFDFDVIFVSSICFSDELMNGIAQRLPRLKTGARFVTMKQVNIPELALAHQGASVMSWGNVSIFVYQRKSSSADS